MPQAGRLSLACISSPVNRFLKVLLTVFTRNRQSDSETVAFQLGVFIPIQQVSYKNLVS
jgi:hypothetical protein